MQCQEDLCTCPATENSWYCAPTCRMGITDRASCACGHHGCANATGPDAV